MPTKEVIAKISEHTPNPGPVFITYRLIKEKALKLHSPYSRYTTWRHKKILKKAGLIE